MASHVYSNREKVAEHRENALPVTMLERIAAGTPVTIDDLTLAIAAVAHALARRGHQERLLLAAIHVRLAVLSRLRTGTDLVDGADVKGFLVNPSDVGEDSPVSHHPGTFRSTPPRIVAAGRNLQRVAKSTRTG